jgi:hypothetical protein
VTEKHTSTAPRRRWTDDAVENELRTQVAALGHFPTRSELISRHARSLSHRACAACGMRCERAAALRLGGPG